MAGGRRHDPMRGIAVAALFWLASPTASALVGTANERAAVFCDLPSADRLSCDLRATEGNGIDDIEARIGDVALDVTRGTDFADSDESIAVLMLVDTSDPARADVIRAIAGQIVRMQALADDRIRIGLGRFDTHFHSLAPIGATATEIEAAAGSLRAVGRTTELYRAVREAIRELEEAPAGRRFLYLFSDGLAEDYAYGHADAIRAARAAGVGIVAVGYARSVALSVALQSLRKLAEDSGGRYVEADGISLPEAFMATPFAGLGSGPRFSVDLAPAIEAGLGDEQRLALLAVTNGRPMSLELAVRLPPVAVTLPELPERPAPSPATAAPPRPPTPAAPLPAGDSKLTTWIWFGTPAAMLLAVVVALVVFGRIWRQRGTDSAVRPATRAEYAYLVRRDGEDDRYVISESPFRIGRSKNNELVLDDNSVSRQHAEIHRRHDGSFTVLDLESLNGVFVNEKKVKTSELNEGDELDVGDVPLRFTLYDADRAAQEPTVMIGTRAP